MNPDTLMNTATALFFLCYIPEFYANYVNKNANVYNVVEKVILLLGTGFALGYAVQTKNQALIINYAPLFSIDVTALSMRAYYAYRNRARDVRALSLQDQIPEYLSHSSSTDIENPLHDQL